ncbi:MAG: hypothetical protein O3A00_27980, partial [Planctomycetota bacterium]|nr:hypothetical protein [Planctomycetota bacterium]
EDNETAIWAPIDTRITITSQIIPRVTPVSLYLPVSRNPAAIKSTTEDWEWLGPFEVLSVGNRLGSLEVMQADNISARQNNILTLRATSKTGQPDANVVALQNYLVQTSYAPLRVKLHAPVRKKDAP